MHRSTAMTLPSKSGHKPKKTMQMPKTLQRILDWLNRIQSLSDAYTNTAMAPLMRWPKRSVTTKPLARSKKEAFDFCLNLWYAFMRIAIARLLDKIPTVMKIMEKKTEIFFSVWQVVFFKIPNPASPGDFELFMVRKREAAFRTLQQSCNQKASAILTNTETL